MNSPLFLRSVLRLVLRIYPVDFRRAVGGPRPTNADWSPSHRRDSDVRASLRTRPLSAASCDSTATPTGGRGSHCRPAGRRVRGLERRVRSADATLTWSLDRQIRRRRGAGTDPQRRRTRPAAAGNPRCRSVRSGIHLGLLSAQLPAGRGRRGPSPLARRRGDLASWWWRRPHRYTGRTPEAKATTTQSSTPTAMWCLGSARNAAPVAAVICPSNTSAATLASVSSSPDRKILMSIDTPTSPV